MQAKWATFGLASEKDMLLLLSRFQEGFLAGTPFDVLPYAHDASILASVDRTVGPLLDGRLLSLSLTRLLSWRLESVVRGCASRMV
jgi:hypothetical protein